LRRIARSLLSREHGGSPSLTALQQLCFKIYYSSFQNDVIRKKILETLQQISDLFGCLFRAATLFAGKNMPEETAITRSPLLQLGFVHQWSCTA